MQKTNYQLHAIRAFLCGRLYGDRQRHAIHIKGIQRLLQDVSSGRHYNASVSPQVEWAGQEVCGHLKKGFKNALGTPTDRAWQQFLQVYRITPTPNTPMGRPPAETMFARKIKSVFDKLIPRQAKFKKTVSPHKKHIYPGDKVPFKAYWTTLHSGKLAPSNIGMSKWYILSRDQKTHTNAIWTSSGNAVWMNMRNYCKKSRSTQYSIISIANASSLSGSATLGKKKKIYATTRRKFQKEEIWIVLFFFKKEKKNSWKWGCCETETYLHHRLFQHYITNVVIS